MKVINGERDKITLELDVEEFADIVSAVSCIREEYEALDTALLDVPLERIEELDQKLTDALQEVNRKRERPSRFPSSSATR